MLLWTPPLIQLQPSQKECFCTMLTRRLWFYLHGIMISFGKALILPSASSLSWLYLLPFSFSAFFHSREGASPVWFTSSLWSDRNRTTAWAPQQAEVPAPLKGASDGVLKKSVFSQLPSTINVNQQDDLDFCCPMPNGSVLTLQSPLQVCALWLWQEFILK